MICCGFYYDFVFTYATSKEDITCENSCFINFICIQTQINASNLKSMLIYHVNKHWMAMFSVFLSLIPGHMYNVWLKTTRMSRIWTHKEIWCMEACILVNIILQQKLSTVTAMVVLRWSVWCGITQQLNHLILWLYPVWCLDLWLYPVSDVRIFESK